MGESGGARCAGSGDCPRAAEPGAPVPLCRQHLELAADWWGDAERGGAAVGVEDALPKACPACGARLGVRWPSAWLCAVCEWRQGDVPDGDLAPPRVDVVYYLRFQDRIKIGTTGDPRQRLAAIWHDELLAFERGDRAVERARHRQFAAQRHARTEWFAADAELLEHVASLAEGHPDPWALHARWRSEAVARRV